MYGSREAIDGCKLNRVRRAAAGGERNIGIEKGTIEKSESGFERLSVVMDGR